MTPSPHIRTQLVKKGEGIIALNQSANRDESVFPDPDRFDIHRQSNPQQVGGRFGGGCKLCKKNIIRKQKRCKEKLQPHVRATGCVGGRGGGRLGMGMGWGWGCVSSQRPPRCVLEVLSDLRRVAQVKAPGRK